MTALVGLGSWFPSLRISNEEISVGLDTSPEWIEARTGIRERRFVSDGLSTVDIAVKAGESVLDRAKGIAIDTLILATTSPDRTCPAGAPEVAARLNLGNISAFDITSACSGFVYGTAIANGLIRAGTSKAVLLIGAEAFSTFVNPLDRTTRPIFGDGGGAALFVADGPGQGFGELVAFDLGSDGEKADLLAVDAGGSRQRSRMAHDLAATPREDFFLHMDGRAIYTQAVARMTESASRVMAACNWSPESIQHFVGHQANRRILEAVAYETGIPPSRMALNIQHYGNTLAASIPALLHELHESNAFKAGDRILVSAFGAGLSWGTFAMIWN
ncbi:beta-ketoacyl-ACP synthase III [Mitsuaria sp. WAJ17]|uniref:beta-ketoacyl-ACP synthase III n=1 Tax=Mitsuaria sp. WAJ17 TaxID=2761452 RepID=UPI001C80D470|nr:beta-ketoacyl-ACP synthase III [Mitsuaria sp. WAJ17]